MKKNISLLTTIILLLSLSGCKYFETKESKAKNLVANQLIDSESAKFSSVFQGANGDSFCGYVNGKNRMGGYAGPVPFIVNLSNNFIKIGKEPLTKEDFWNLDLMRRAQRFDEYVKINLDILERCNFPDLWEKSCKTEVYSLAEMPKRMCSILKNDSSKGLDFMKAVADEFKSR